MAKHKQIIHSQKNVLFDQIIDILIYNIMSILKGDLNGSRNFFIILIICNKR